VTLSEINTGPATSNGTAAAPLLQVTDLYKHFPLRGGTFIRHKVGEVQAVSGVSFDIAPGETLGLVGESGCGKSTTGRAVLQLLPPTSGSVIFDGVELTKLKGPDMRRKRSDIQVVFQDPFASLDPRLPVGEAIAEPLAIHGERRPTPGWPRCSNWLASSRTTPTATPTSSRAVSASESASLEH
jgi:peptide/nickel transport system ATP-binding protein/oligopeptide transport system ATP-binding protein